MAQDFHYTSALIRQKRIDAYKSEQAFTARRQQELKERSRGQDDHRRWCEQVRELDRRRGILLSGVHVVSDTEAAIKRWHAASKQLQAAVLEMEAADDAMRALGLEIKYKEGHES